MTPPTHPWRNLARELAAQLDHEAIPTLIEAASLDAGHIRNELSDAGLEWYEPAAGRLPEPHVLDATANAVVGRATRDATWRGGLSGALGALAIPPEVAVALVQSLHTAQRLAVVFGHDPQQDAGRVLVVRAMAAAWDIPLPRQGTVGMRVRDLPELVRPGALSQGLRPAVLARALAGRVWTQVVGRAARAVPGLGAGFAAVRARRLCRRQGQRMTEVFRSAWEGSAVFDGPVQDAIEVGS